MCVRARARARVCVCVCVCVRACVRAGVYVRACIIVRAPLSFTISLCHPRNCLHALVSNHVLKHFRYSTNVLHTNGPISLWFCVTTRN